MRLIPDVNDPERRHETEITMHGLKYVIDIVM